MSDAAETPAPALDVGRSLASGGAWMVGLRWGLRCLGLVNTFILARLLAPSDFGLVAMAMVVIGMIEMLGQTGQMLALIRIPNPTREHYNSAFTLTLMIAAVLTLALWAVAPLAALYYHEPRAEFMVRLMAMRTLMGGFQNIYVVRFRKDLHFGREFSYQFLQRFLVIATTIVFAVILRDWRALVIGILGGQFLGLISSYIMAPYRPGLSVRRIPEMLSFSLWTLVTAIAQYINGRADQFIVGGFTGAGALGLYNVAADAATAPAMEITIPVTRALFPVFARIKDDVPKMRSAYLDVFGAAAIMSIAVGGGMALVAPDFTAVVLGHKWLAAAPLVRILSISGALYGIMHAGIPVMTATGHARLSAQITTSRAAGTVVATGIAAYLFRDMTSVAMARTVITLVFIPGIFLQLSRVLPVTVADMLGRLWRPLIAGLVMAAAVLAAHEVAPPIAWVRLFTDSFVGAAAYTLALPVLWLLAGRPEGLEGLALRRLWARILGRRRAADMA